MSPAWHWVAVTLLELGRALAFAVALIAAAAGFVIGVSAGEAAGSIQNPVLLFGIAALALIVRRVLGSLRPTPADGS